MDEKDFKEEELLKEINAGIGKQIAHEMGGNEPDQEPYEDRSLMEEEASKNKSRFKKRYIAFGAAGLVLVLILSGVLIVRGMLNRITVETPEDVEWVETDLTEEELKAYEEKVANATEKPLLPAEEEVINILLIGEEAMGDAGGRGRSDSMMIASINQREKTLSLTSILRDSYVKIPGYKNNKLNAAYNNGGGFLLQQTIEENFDIHLDGFVRVSFDAFETIVDLLGGVEITLNESEAYYLNTTNYISKKKYRNVVPGVNLFNGNQALGYCRIRKKTAGNGENNDFGRTYRQRAVLTAIFNKYKTKNPVEMIKIGSSLLDYVSTNIDTNKLVSFLTTAAMQGTTELRTFRIPADGTYKDEFRYCGNSRGDVLVLDFEENIRLLREFIYGDALAAELGPIPTDNQDIGIHGTSGTISSNTAPVYNTPTKAPVVYSTPTPTEAPTEIPTEAPTVDPNAPTVDPNAPTVDPNAPTVDPNGPTVDPNAPTVDPNGPTVDPNAPTVPPTNVPTANPGQPTAAPNEPTAVPTQAPSEVPAVNPEEPTIPPAETVETPVPEVPSETPVPEEGSDVKIEGTPEITAEPLVETPVPQQPSAEPEPEEEALE